MCALCWKRWDQSKPCKLFTIGGTASSYPRCGSCVWTVVIPSFSPFWHFLLWINTTIFLSQQELSPCRSFVARSSLLHKPTLSPQALIGGWGRWWAGSSLYPQSSLKLQTYSSLFPWEVMRLKLSNFCFWSSQHMVLRAKRTMELYNIICGFNSKSFVWPNAI